MPGLGPLAAFGKCLLVARWDRELKTDRDVLESANSRWRQPPFLEMGISAEILTGGAQPHLEWLGLVSTSVTLLGTTSAVTGVVDELVWLRSKRGFFPGKLLGLAFPTP